MKNLRTIFKSEAGEISLPAVIISTIVSGCLLAGAAAGISSVMKIHGQAAVAFSSTADRQNLSTALSRDVSHDSIIAATPTHLEFLLADEGQCRVSIWDISEGEHGQTVTNSVYAYADVHCDGEPNEHPAISISTPVADAEFVVKSRVGRVLTVENRNPSFKADDAIPTDGSEPIETANQNAWPESVELSTADAQFSPFARI